MHRGFDCGAWGDPWFQLLPTPAEKIVFINLFTNRATTSCGSIEIIPKTISFETGVPEEDVAVILRRWNGEHKARVVWLEDYTLVWVRNFFKHQNFNPNFAKAASREAATLPDELRNLIYAVYPQLAPNSRKSPPSDGEDASARTRNGSDRLPNHSEPYDNPSETVTEPSGKGLVSVPNQDRTESGKNQERVRTGQDRKGAGATVPAGALADMGDVVVSLLSLGVSVPVAQRLASEHSADKIRQQIAWLPSRKARDPAGMIVKAVVSDMMPPKTGSAAAEKRKRQDAERQRQLSAKAQEEQDAEAREKAERMRCQRAFEALSLDNQAYILRLAEGDFDNEEEYAHIRGMPDSRLKARLVGQTVNTIRNRLMADRRLLTEGKEDG